MANDNIKRYLDYDGLLYLVNKFNSIIEDNEYTTSESLNDLNQKIAELTDNPSGFPIIDADITQIDSVYTTTENLNELITPGQYIVDSSKIQYEGDNFIKTLYWLLSVDKVVYNNSESIIQTYYPLSYLTYNWYNIPIGGLLQRFYEGNNTWTDLQVAAPGDVDTTKFVSQTEFNETITPYTENIKFIEISEPIFTTSYLLNTGEYTITNGNTTPIDNLFDPGIYYIKCTYNIDSISSMNGFAYILHVLELIIGTTKFITQIFELYNAAQFYGNPQSLRFCRCYDPSKQTWSVPTEVEFSKKLKQPVLYNTDASKRSGEEPGYIDPGEEFIYVLKDPITTGDDKDMSIRLTGYADSHYIELKIHKSYKMPTQLYVDNCKALAVEEAKTYIDNKLDTISLENGGSEASDETLKDFQDSIQVNFEQLKEIPKAYFTFKDDKTGEVKIGTSAQKVKEFYPELVNEDENGILYVNYAKLSIIALKAVDELDDRITKLENLVQHLLENK